MIITRPAFMPEQGPAGVFELNLKPCHVTSLIQTINSVDVQITVDLISRFCPYRYQLINFIRKTKEKNIIIQRLCNVNKT